MVTTNQKPTTDTQKPVRKQPKHSTKEDHMTTMEEINEEEMNREKLQKQLANK